MEIEWEAKGYYHQTEKYIAIQENMSNLQTMKTGVHEVSHALLHDREVMDAEGILKDRTTKEVEAESIAYIVCNHFGLDTSEYSFTYIASWCESKDMKALRASMDTIRKTSADCGHHTVHQSKHFVFVIHLICKIHNKISLGSPERKRSLCHKTGSTGTAECRKD